MYPNHVGRQAADRINNNNNNKKFTELINLKERNTN